MDKYRFIFTFKKNSNFYFLPGKGALQVCSQFFPRKLSSYHMTKSSLFWSTKIVELSMRCRSHHGRCCHKSWDHTEKMDQETKLQTQKLIIEGKWKTIESSVFKKGSYFCLKYGKIVSGSSFKIGDRYTSEKFVLFPMQ